MPVTDTKPEGVDNPEGSGRSTGVARAAAPAVQTVLRRVPTEKDNNMDAPKVEPERESPERDKSEDVPAGIVKTPTPIAAVDVGSPSTFHPGAPDLPAPMPAGRKVPTGPGGASSMPSPADPSILVAAGTPTSIFHSAMEKNPTIPVARVGIALSGGGSKGDFEVGALRYLYDHTFVRPDIICGTSVGSINGVQLSEGADTSLAELESIWLNAARTGERLRLPAGACCIPTPTCGKQSNGSAT